jgi:hypothetical protein
MSKEMRRYINSFRNYNLLNETLKSDKIDIVVKKLDNFFNKKGLNKKSNFGSEVNSPYYQIITDKVMMNRMLSGYRDKNDSLTKSLIKSGINIDNTISELERQISEFNYGDVSIFTDFNNKELSLELISLINSMGYFISVVNLKAGEKLKDKNDIEKTLTNSDRISIMIEPNYDDKIDFNGEYLYHTTDSKNLDKILKYGLIPKSKNTRSFYPERIYLSPNEDWMSSIRQELVGDKGGEYINLRIKNFKRLSLYKDVRFKGGFFTYDNISPKYIELI